METSIAICITTHNRYAETNRCVAWWNTMRPQNSRLIIVDDASVIPYEIADYRFQQQVGIAKAKNKCLELAENFDYIFLADNDIWPLASDWWKPYINSGLNHAMYIFDRQPISTSGASVLPVKHNEYALPRGCLLFIKKKVLKIVGGMDEAFGLYSYEHASWSDRIYNAGLTPGRYIDIPNSQGLFYSLDEADKITSSVPDEIRASHIRRNKKLYEENFNSKQFIPYK